MTSIIFEDKSKSEKKVLDEVFEEYIKAAEQGLADAQYNLGWCYRSGTGIDKDEQRAVEWYQKAAEQGNTVAQNTLGVCYDYGIGVEKDKKRQLNCFKKQLKMLIILLHRVILVGVIDLELV